jgi:signal transduction histidine kinase
MAPELAKLIAKSWTDASSFFADEKGDVVTEVDKFPLKRIVSVPIRTHGRAYGVLALFNANESFKFMRKELNLLHQFIYLIGLALENAFMVEEIEQSSQQLRLLTDKVLTIREQERKRLAADIHDTLAQALTGIGYKIRFCGELAKRMPELVGDELERLIDTVNQAVDQCRGLISSLRPDLIDTLGLVPALRQLFHTYTGATGIKVAADLPKKVKSSPDVSICLYRVAQEALTNIHKHAGVKIATVKLKERAGNIILVVSDNGKGFNNSSSTPWKANPNKLGLLYTKERVDSVGGTLKIDAGMDRGCTVEAKIPINIEETSHEQNKSHDRR